LEDNIDNLLSLPFLSLKRYNRGAMDKKWKFNETFITQQLHDSLTLFDPEKSTLITFNDTSARIFLLLKKGSSEKAIIQTIVKEYDVAQSIAKADLYSLLDTLKECGVIKS